MNRNDAVVHDFPARWSLAAKILFGALALTMIVDSVLMASGSVSGSLLTPHQVMYDGVIIGAAVLCGLRAAVVRDERLIWALMTCGLAFWALAQLYFTLAGPDLPFPSLADGFWLAFYIPMYAAIVLLVRSRLRHISASLWFDGVVGALGVASVSAAVVFDVVLADTHGSFSAVATNLAYPVADLLLLSLVVAVAVMSGAALFERAWMLIAAALVLFTVVDSLYLVGVAEGTYVNYGLLDAGWPVALLMFGWAAWQPRRIIDVRATRRSSVVVPIGLSMLALAVLIFDHFHRTNLLALSLASLCILAVAVRLAIAFRDNRRILEATHSLAMTDPVTGLGSRYQLMRDLEQRLRAGGNERSVLVLADLDGFKGYNDTFGHPAGDALLQRLGTRLHDALGAHGSAHRMGGDEFCALIDPQPGESCDTQEARCKAALSEQGHGFAVRASCGAVTLDGSGMTAEDALKIADRRMYANKQSGRASAFRQSADVLLAIVQEGDLALSTHLTNVAALSELAARASGLEEEEVARIRLAGALHDIGKVAIPDEILSKTGALTGPEQAFMRQHTIIGQRIVAVAPALAPVGDLIRSSHERYDGTGYPDRLAGESIPFGAQIVFACDAFDAMTTDRPHSNAISEPAALTELRRCSGTQFSPRAVAALYASRHANLQVAGSEDRRRVASVRV